jgi:hypothetical protein
MRARHTLVVQNRERVRTKGHEELQPTGEPISVRGTVHPLDAAEIQFYGDRALETRKFFGPSWPGNIDCRITFDGDEWDQVEPAAVHGIGQASRHVEVIIRRRTSRG